jgi:DNA-directed RNA polymerase subunit M/transcription elongation factor TFIIS
MTEKNIYGTLALSKIIKNKSNIDIFEKNINKLSSSEDDYKRNIYQLAGDILNSKSLSLQNKLKEIKENKIGWNHPVYNDIKNKLKEQDDYILNPFSVTEGVITCFRCKSTKTISYNKATRSSDEGITVHVTCSVCYNKWTMDS